MVQTSLKKALCHKYIIIIATKHYVVITSLLYLFVGHQAHCYSGVVWGDLLFLVGGELALTLIKKLSLPHVPNHSPPPASVLSFGTAVRQDPHV